MCWILSPVGRSVEGLSRVSHGRSPQLKVVFLLYKVDRLLEGLRSFSVKPYVVFYILIPGGIEILRIIHQARDIEDQFSL